jgi:hypothetical protein
MTPELSAVVCNKLITQNCHHIHIRFSKDCIFEPTVSDPNGLTLVLNETASGFFTVQFSNCTFRSFSSSPSINITIQKAHNEEVAYSVLLVNCSFYNNSMGSLVISTQSTAHVFFIECNFTSNTNSPVSGKGGAGIIAELEGEFQLVIERSHFENNVASKVGGGAVLIIAGRGGGGGGGEGLVSISNSNFTNNSILVGNGGAVNLEGQSNVTMIVLETCFHLNEATSGGGIIASGFHILNVTNSVFDSNGAPNSLFPSPSIGGAIALGAGELAVISNTTFFNNVAADMGGALCMEGEVTTRISSCSFSGNSAYLGGALGSYSNISLFADFTNFTGNIAFGGGVASVIYSDISYEFSDCHFSENYALDFGGVVFLTAQDSVITFNKSVIDSNYAKGPSQVQGGVFYITNGEVFISNTLVTHNGIQGASGLGTVSYINGGSFVAEESIFTENYLMEARYPTFYLGSGLLNLSSCLLQDNKGGIQAKSSLAMISLEKSSFYNESLQFQAIGSAVIDSCSFYNSRGSQIALSGVNTTVIHTTFINKPDTMLSFDGSTLVSDSLVSQGHIYVNGDCFFNDSSITQTNFYIVSKFNLDESSTSVVIHNTVVKVSYLELFGFVIFNQTSLTSTTIEVQEGTTTLLRSNFGPRGEEASIILNTGILLLNQSSFCPRVELRKTPGISCQSPLALIAGDSSNWQVSPSCTIEQAYSTLSKESPSLTASTCHSYLVLIQQDVADAYFTLRVARRPILSTALSLPFQVSNISSIGLWSAGNICNFTDTTAMDKEDWTISSSNCSFRPLMGQSTIYCLWLNISDASELTLTANYTPRYPTFDGTQLFTFANSFIFNFQSASINYQFFDQLGNPIAIAAGSVSVTILDSDMSPFPLLNCTQYCQFSVPTISNGWRAWIRIRAQLSTGGQVVGDPISCTGKENRSDFSLLHLTLPFSIRFLVYYSYFRPSWCWNPRVSDCPSHQRESVKECKV